MTITDRRTLLAAAAAAPLVAAPTVLRAQATPLVWRMVTSWAKAAVDMVRATEASRIVRSAVMGFFLCDAGVGRPDWGRGTGVTARWALPWI